MLKPSRLIARRSPPRNRRRLDQPAWEAAETQQFQPDREGNHKARHVASGDHSSGRSDTVSTASAESWGRSRTDGEESGACDGTRKRMSDEESDGRSRRSLSF